MELSTSECSVTIGWAFSDLYLVWTVDRTISRLSTLIQNCGRKSFLISLVRYRPLMFGDPSTHEKTRTGNAFKYTLEGTITVKMRISPLWATFSVIDTGVGIPAEDIDRSK